VPLCKGVKTVFKLKALTDLGVSPSPYVRIKAEFESLAAPMPIEKLIIKLPERELGRIADKVVALQHGEGTELATADAIFSSPKTLQ
jgi:hypothetical protein